VANQLWDEAAKLPEGAPHSAALRLLGAGSLTAGALSFRGGGSAALKSPARALLAYGTSSGRRGHLSSFVRVDEG
jgi:hypothetical protein